MTGLCQCLAATVLVPLASPRRDFTDEGSTAGLLEPEERTFGPVDLVAAIAGGDGAPSSIMELGTGDFRWIAEANPTFPLCYSC